MLHQASTKIKEEQINEHLDDFQYDIKRMEDNFHEKGS